MKLPAKLRQIPEEFWAPASKQGSLVDFTYNTWESFSYEKHTIPLRKHAVVYLPHGYSSGKHYPAFYLIHGGWSDETAYLGTPEHPDSFKNVLDNAISVGDIAPMIVICPTYNNQSGSDSSDYGLALQLTARYPRELLCDLIPAVDSAYFTIADRDHRAFCGLSMGAVTTWRVFEQGLIAFRYFFPSSGELTTDDSVMADIVRQSGMHWNDFFIFAASGSQDFAYPAFRRQIQSMTQDPSHLFRVADQESQGNLWFLVQKGGKHNKFYALEYFFNAMSWVWREDTL